ncbi:MAG: CoA protein activase [Candidatus Sumerlaeia bacterium]|nr:CoA protein activase [Candidatus Sumerlaeia bacterium]
MAIFCKGIAVACGFDYLVPPESTRRTLELGCRNSGDGLCLPYRMILGNFIEALDRGADTIIMLGSGPPCRLGLYDLVMKTTLADMGYRYRWLTIPGGWRFEDLRRLEREGRRLRHEVRFRQLARLPYALKVGWQKMVACENIERAAQRIRPRELTRGAADAAFRRALALVDAADDLPAIANAADAALALMEQVPQDTDLRPLRVAIVGELYTVMDHRINCGVERILGELGVEVSRGNWFSVHISRNTGLNRVLRERREEILRASYQYLGYNVGAECNISVGETILAAREGLDGVVHILPFSCMPESVASAILVRVSRDYDIPVLTLHIDENTSPVRLTTQLEAFTDTLLWRRRK